MNPVSSLAANAALLSTAALLVVAALPAQSIRADLSTRGVTAVFAGPNVQASNPSQPIPGRLDLGQTFRGGSGATTQFATAQSEAAVTLVQTVQLRAAAVAFDVAGGGAVRAGTAVDAAGTPGAQAYAGAFRSVTPQTGKLVVRYIGDISGTATGSASITTAAGGTQSFVADGTNRVLEIPNVVANAAGLAFTVRVDAQAVASLPLQSGTTVWDVEVAFEVPGTPRCTVTPETASCAAGGSLTGTSTFGGTFEALQLTVNGAPAQAQALLLLSTRIDTLPLPLPGSNGCIVLSTNPVLLPFGGSGPDGSFRNELRVPAGIPATIWGQIAFVPLFGTPQVSTSNTVRISCP